MELGCDRMMGQLRFGQILYEGNPKNMTQKEVLADGLLLLTALIWGSAFAVVKNTLDSFAPGAIIAMRYVIGAAITAVLFRKHLKEIKKADVIRGALVGFCCAAPI